MINRLLHRQRRRFAVMLTGGLLIVGLMAAAGSAVWLTDSGTVDVQVPNKTQSKVDQQTAQGAFVSYFGDSDTTFGASGTGTFNPFVRLQASPTEQGYNTNGTVEYDTKTGTWTHAIKVSEIPQRPCPQVNPSPPPAVGSLTCFELFNDINENNSTPYISLNKVEVYFTSSATLTGYPFTGNATPEYKFDGDVLIHDVNQGSGRGDLRYDIPINGPNPIDLAADAPNCNYGNPLCNTYFVLYSQWGTSTAASPDGKGYSSDGGFEEWKVKVYPTPPDISVVKTPDGGSINAGQNAAFSIVVTNNGPVTATGVTLTDTLPDSGLSWTVGGADAASCTITSGVLNCNFGDIPFPGSKTITLTSPTTASNCGAINNTATVSATNEDQSALGNNSDSGSITVNCAAIQILKQSTKSGNPLVSKDGAVFSVTGPGGYSASVTDNGTGDEDSTVGKVCVSGLAPGTYTVNETTPPSGYGGASQSGVSATAANGTNCSDSKPTDANSAVFTNPPLADIQVNYKDGGSGETSATINCVDSSSTDIGSNDATPTSGWDTSETDTNLPPDTYTCTVTIDP